MAPRKKQTPSELAEANLRQLQLESQIPKIKVSEAAKDLQAFIEARQNQDYLVKGFASSPKKNPFRKKRIGMCNLF